MDEKQPSNGGLSGWPATIMNMSAIGFALLLTWSMYWQFVETVKERDVLIREEMRESREADTRNTQAITQALNGMERKLESVSQLNAALIMEMRAGRAIPKD